MTKKNRYVCFNKKYSKCQKCRVSNVDCEFEDKHKSKRRRLNISKNGFYCRGPKSNKMVYSIKKHEYNVLFKTICQKCQMLKLCESITAIDGNCGISACSRNILKINSNLIFCYNGAYNIHYHDICKECYDGISRNISINLCVNDTFTT